MKITRIVLLLLILTAAALLVWWHYVRPSYELSSRVFGGRKAFATFLSASEVTAERVRCNSPDGSASLSDYRRDSLQSLSRVQIDQIRRLFKQRDSYLPELWRLKGGESIVSSCGPPFYGVLFTFHSAPTVRIALCFRCREFGVFVGDDDRSSFVNRDTDFGLMRPILVSLVKSIYPNDPEIQSLKVE